MTTDQVALDAALSHAKTLEASVASLADENDKLRSHNRRLRDALRSIREQTRILDSIQSPMSAMANEAGACQTIGENTTSLSCPKCGHRFA